jgi:antitoxin HigA-1
MDALDEVKGDANTMTTRSRRTRRRPSLPGEILVELYLAPHEISIAAFAEACGVTRKHMSGIVHGHVGITAEMAARIAAALGTTAQYWLNLQNAVDLARRRPSAAPEVRTEVPADRASPGLP